MKVGTRARLSVLASVIWMAGVSATAAAPERPPIADRFAEVNGVRLHYLVAGEGAPILLLHGYAQTSHMWRPLVGELAKTHTVIAPDLRGFGLSSKPAAGYDKKTMAQDVHALAAALGFRQVQVVGHDIGLMVAYAYAAQYPWSALTSAVPGGSSMAEACGREPSIEATGNVAITGDDASGMGRRLVY